MSIENLFYFGDAGLIHGGSFASKDSHGHHVMSITHDDESKNEVTASRMYVWSSDIDNEKLAEWCGMDVLEYMELPEYVRAIDQTRYYGQESDNWKITLPFEGEDPYFFDDDNETILAAIAAEGIGMNEIPVSIDWEKSM